MKTALKLISLVLLLSLASCGSGKDSSQSIDDLLANTSRSSAATVGTSTGSNTNGSLCDFNFIVEYNSLIIKCSPLADDSYACQSQYAFLMSEYPEANCKAGDDASNESSVITINTESFKEIKDAGMNR